MIVKAYMGKGKFMMWSDVVRIDRLDPETAFSYPMEEYLLEREPPEGEPPIPSKLFRMTIHRGPVSIEDGGADAICVRSQHPVYIMNDKGDTIESFN